MRACKCLCVAFVAVGLLATTALGARPIKKAVTADPNADPNASHPLPVTGGGPGGGAALPPTNTCPADDSGVLDSAGGSIVGSTVGNTNDFGDAGQSTDGTVCDAASWSNGGASGPDAITSFQVDATGLWQFTTCGNGFDSSLMVLAADAAGDCPGLTPVGCNGDDGGSCGDDPNFAFESLVEVELCAGTTYFLLIDGWGETDEGDFDVAFANVGAGAAECAADADCDDGLFCTGVESCVGGCNCKPGAGNPCPASSPICDEDTDTCLTCDDAPDPDAFCDDGIFCNGVEACVDGTCVVSPRCERFQACDEASTSCIDPDPCLVWETFEIGGFFFPAANQGCTDSFNMDDAELEGPGRDLISWQFSGFARDFAGDEQGTTYNVVLELFSVLGGGDCGPDAPIEGAGCTSTGTVLPGGSPADVHMCEPNGGLPSGVILPDGDQVDQCGIDVFVAYHNSILGFGFGIAGGTDPPGSKIIGLPGAADDFGQEVFVLEDCPPTGAFGFTGFSPPTVNDFGEASICTQPVGPCCIGTGGCELLSEADCDAAGGAFQGDSILSNPASCDNTGDGDDVADACDNCPATTNFDQADCNGDGVGDACEADTDNQDDDNDGCCNGVDGCPNDALKPGDAPTCTQGGGLGEAPGQCGCGNLDDDTDRDGTADCIDNCPSDPGKIDPGECGCGTPDVGDDDDDGVLNCNDVCRGVDDAVFAPECLGAIPTVSEWGLVILSLLLLVAGKVYFGRRSATA